MLGYNVAIGTNYPHVDSWRLLLTVGGESLALHARITENWGNGDTRPNIRLYWENWLHLSHATDAVAAVAITQLK